MINKSCKNLFSIRDLDGHYIIIVFGIQFRFKHKQKFNCPTVHNIGIIKSTRNPKIILSLTSFPARIPSLHYTIRTLLTQSLKPDKVILYLAESQFPNRESDLTKELIELKNFGLTIRWCEDLKSYKKLIFALKEFPDDIVITVDDDIYYSKDTIETLYNSYLKNPKEIQCHRCARIEIDGDEIKRISSKRLFNENYTNPSFYNRLTGCGAVLYPPNCFYKDVLREDIFMQLIPTHDDVWFWAMATLNDFKCRVVKGYTQSLIFIDNTQNSGLCKINTSSGELINEAYKKIVSKYPELLNILRAENGN